MARSARFSKKRSCPRTSASIGCDLWDAVLGLVSGSSGKAGEGLSERQGLAGRGHLLRRGSQRQGCWIAYLSGSKASSRQGRKSILGEVWTLGQLVRVQAGRRHAGFQRFTAKSRHLLQEGFGKIRDGTGLWCLLFRRDRKSTRLNSSHVAISYAVFCLK